MSFSTLEKIKSFRPRVAKKPPQPPKPLIDTKKLSPEIGALADVINQTAAPFQTAPDPAKGALGEIEQGIGAVMGVVGAPFELMDTGFAMLTQDMAALMPGLPAATLTSPHLGMLHGHLHPPSLIPPSVVPIPLPSIGAVMCAGCVSVFVGGLPAARASDMGLAISCCSLAPAFEVYTGSSNTFIGGSRAARMADITRHCNPLSAIGKAMAAIGVVAGAVSAGANFVAGQQAQGKFAALQAAADAAALAMSALVGKDPGVPPVLGAVMLGNSSVLVGGFPMPDVLDLIGGLLKGLKKIGQAVRSSKRVRQAFKKVGRCIDPGEPVNSFSGNVYNDFEDYVAPSGLRWERHYRSDWNDEEGVLGYGFRHFYDRRLTFLRTRALYESHDGEETSIPRDDNGGFIRDAGFTLIQLSSMLWRLTTDRDEELDFTILSTTPPTGQLVRYSRRNVSAVVGHDDHGRIERLTEWEGESCSDIKLIYGDDGRIAEVRGGLRGDVPKTICRYSYTDGCLTAWHDSVGATIRFRYDSARRMIQGTDRRGYSFHWRYDPVSGRCIEAHGDDGLWGIKANYENGVSTFVEADNGEWTFKHFADGVVSHRIDPEGGVLQYVREDDRIVEQITPGGTRFRWLYDHRGKHYGRADQWGNQYLPEDLDPNPNDPLAHNGPLTQKAWMYGRPIARLLITPDSTLPVEVVQEIQRIDAKFFLSQSAPLYLSGDAPDGLLRQLDADGHAHPYTRDGHGNILDAEKNVIAYEHGHGRWFKRKIASWNLIAAEESPLGNVTGYTYNHRELRQTVTDPAGNYTEYCRDQLQRVIKECRNGELYRRFVYDNHDKVVEEYDGVDAVVQLFETGSHGLHTKATLTSGEIFTFDYDGRGRPTDASSTQHKITLEHLRELRTADKRDDVGIEHVYDATHRIVRTTCFGRFIVEYRYRGEKGIRIRTPEGGEHHFRKTERGALVRQNANRSCEVTVYDSYDRLRLRHCWNTSRQSRWTQVFEYTDAGEMHSWNDSEQGLRRFEYDDDHRLTTQTQRDIRQEYTYDKTGNLTRTPEFEQIGYDRGNVLKHAGPLQFEHDHQQRRSKTHTDDGTISYEYDSRGQLIEVRWSNRSAVWRACYDGLGRRLWREYDGERTDFYWDGDRLAVERSPAGQLRVYVYVNEDAIVPFMWLDYESEHAAPDSGTAYYLYAAPNGMPLRVTDCEDNTVWQAESVSAYGLIEVAAGARVSLCLRFAGHFYDEYLGFFYNRFRDFDPKTGRYLQPDPIGHEGSVNLYVYPANPLVDVDLRGLVHKKGKPGKGEEQTQALQEFVHDEIKKIQQDKDLSNSSRRSQYVMVSGGRRVKSGDMEANNNHQARTKKKFHRIVRVRIKTQNRIIETTLRRITNVRDLSADELRRELQKDGIPATVQGMDTVEAIRGLDLQLRHWESKSLSSLEKGKAHEKRLVFASDEKGNVREGAKKKVEIKTAASAREAALRGLKAENGAHGEVKTLSDILYRIEESEGRDAHYHDIADVELDNLDVIHGNPMPRCGCCRGITQNVDLTKRLQEEEDKIGD